MLLGIELAKICGVVCFTLESDSWNVVNCFSMVKEPNLSSCGPLAYHFQREVQGLRFRGFFTIIKCQNKVADSLDRFECFLSIHVLVRWLYT